MISAYNYLNFWICHIGLINSLNLFSLSVCMCVCGHMHMHACTPVYVHTCVDVPPAQKYIQAIFSNYLMVYAFSGSANPF